jgi:hypothetical protein
MDTEDLPRFPELNRPVQRRRQKGLTELARLAAHRQPIRPDELGSAPSTEPVPLRWIVFPRFGNGSEDGLHPAGGAEALFRFAETRLNLHVWGERALVFMRQLLETVPVSLLTISDPERAADLLVQTAPSMVGVAS